MRLKRNKKYTLFRKPYPRPTSIETKFVIVTLVSLLCLCPPCKENALPNPSSGGRETGKGYLSKKAPPKYKWLCMCQLEAGGREDIGLDCVTLYVWE